MKKITQTIEVKRYLANDGTPFKTEDECISYENEQKQKSLEDDAIEKLGIETINSNFPSMLDSRHKAKYMLFYIENENDLEIFCKAYEDYWFSNSTWQLDRETFTYPEVLCILDFEQGSEDYRIYRISQLFRQFYAFEDELNYVIGKKNERDKK